MKSASAALASAAMLQRLRLRLHARCHALARAHDVVRVGRVDCRRTLHSSTWLSAASSSSSSSSSTSSSTQRPSGSAQHHPDYYALLEVTRTHTPTELRNSYYRLAKQFHPDVIQHYDHEVREWAERRFRLIGIAYQVLSDPRKRQHYDTFVDLTSIGDQDRMLHWMAIHRPPEQLAAMPTPPPKTSS